MELYEQKPAGKNGELRTLCRRNGERRRVATVKHYYQSQGNGAEAARRLAF